MQIRIQHQDGRDECITLDASQMLRFGTRRSADVVLHGAGIFPIHFGIVFHRGAFTVAASQQARKVLVNGTRVNKAALHGGDRIELGKTVITVLDDDGAVEPLEDLVDELAGPLDDLSDDIAGPLDDLSDDFLGASVTHDGAMTERSVPHTRVRAERTSPPALERIVQSVWFVRVLLASVLLPLAALIGIYIGQLPTAEEQFAIAADAYRQEDFPRAVERFDRFLTRHPRHDLADEARMKRDMARLLDRFDRGADAMTLVNESRVATEAWQHLPPPDVQRSLAQILPELVWDLIRTAQSTSQRSTKDAQRDAQASAAEGLQMIYKLLPAALQRDRDVDRLQAALTTLERNRAQADSISTAVTAIGRAGAAGDLALIARARQELVGEYPQLATDARLLRALRNVVQNEAVRARLAETAQDSTHQATDHAAAAVQVAVPESGTVVGLDARTGGRLWQRVAEPPAVCVRDPDAPRDYMVADQLFLCVMSRPHHELLAAHYLGHEPGCVWLPPWIVGDYVLISEQLGPGHSSLHVLRRGDELPKVQTLLLTGVVSGAPAALGESVFLPIDGGRVCVLHYRAGDASRPFSDPQDCRLPESRPDPDTRLQLAIVHDQLWVAGPGVAIYRPGAAGQPPTFVQQVWEDLHITQPLCLAGDIVVAAGRRTGLAGVEVRAWDTAGGRKLWTCELAAGVSEGRP